MWWLIGLVGLLVGIWVLYEVRSWKKPKTNDYEQPGWRPPSPRLGGKGGAGGGSGVF